MAALGALVVALSLVLTFSKVGGTTTHNVTRSFATTGGGTRSKETPAAFLNMLASAIRSGDAQFMLTHLNPAVIAAYGSSACRKVVATYTDPTAAFSIRSTDAPSAYSYTVNGKTRIVPDTITAQVIFTQQGKAAPETIHLSRGSDGKLTWYTACAAPGG